MKKSVRILLIVIALVCFGIALYYPISEYVMQKQSVSTMDRLAALRDEGLEEAQALATEPPETEAPQTEEPIPEEETAEPEAQEKDEQQDAEKATEQPQAAETTQPAAPIAPQNDDAVPVTEAPVASAQTAAPAAAETKGTTATTAAASETTAAPVANTQTAAPAAAETQATTAATTAVTAATEAPVTNVQSASSEVQTAAPVAQSAQTQQGVEETPSPTPTDKPTPSPTPTATPDRRVTTGAKIWDDLEKVALDETKILPQYRKLYAINNEMVGWLTISGTKIDYPVMQTADEEYYLSHDFFHEENANGLLIMDSHCDPYTPSYNLVISGHNRKNDTIFSRLTEYFQDKRHRDAHMFIQFDSLMEERTYVVFAAFFAADYDVNEEGFRYNANIEYAVDAKQWLREINEYKLYETNIDVGFGDQFLTLTTCNSSKRKNGRFVVVARRVRDGETFD